MKSEGGRKKKGGLAQRTKPLAKKMDCARCGIFCKVWVSVFGGVTDLLQMRDEVASKIGHGISAGTIRNHYKSF